MAQTARNRVQQISVDHRRDEIQVFRGRGVVRQYPISDRRLDTLRSFDDCDGYRFNEAYYG